jgi:hypothetical protein
MKKCSPSLVISEMQIRTTMRYYFTPTRMPERKKTSVGKYVHRFELLSIASGNLKSVHSLGQTV